MNLEKDWQIVAAAADAYYGMLKSEVSTSAADDAKFERKRKAVARAAERVKAALAQHPR